MGDYSDEIGDYFGELKDGFPHGKGIKMYKNGTAYEGNWDKGRKHGLGILDTCYCKVQIKFSYGIPRKILNYPIKKVTNKTEILLDLFENHLPVGNYYKEIGATENSRLGNTYVLVYNPITDKISFRSKLLKIDNFKFIYGISSIFDYIAQKCENEIKGMFELNTFFFSYIGNGKELIPEGQGKLYFSDGSKISGNFVNGILAGFGKFINKDFRIDLNFIDGIPCGNFEFIYQGIAGVILINDMRLYLNCQSFESNNIKKTLKELVLPLLENAMKFKELFTIDSILRARYGKIVSLIKRGNDFYYDKKPESSLDFKGYKSWKEYENKKSLNFGIEKLVKEKGIYIGDTPKGKGKIIFNDGERYKGEAVNVIINGFGKYWYNDGSVYVGEFFKGKKHGIGMMIYSDNHYYKGDWKDDNMCGQGIWKKENQKIKAFNITKRSQEKFIGIFTDNLS